MQSETENYNETTTEPTLHPVLKQDLKFVIIPLAVLGLVMFLSALVYLMAKRRRLELVRENLLSLYEFDSVENEWESPLMTSNSDHDDYGSFRDYGSTAL